jgi:hypothetical protein
MVCASETLGANPELRASLTTASVSDFHHSAAIYGAIEHKSSSNQNTILLVEIEN